MNPNQANDPNRTAYGRNQQVNSRDKQRDDAAARTPGCVPSTPWSSERRTAAIACHQSSPNNQLLASLPPEVADELQSRIEAVDLEAGAMLYEAGTVLRHVYFPVTAVVSLVSPLQDGACAEVAVVGREGVAGVCAFMGGGKALSSAVVQRPGSAWRMSACDIADLARDFEPVMQQLLRYTQALFTHMAQTSACHRHHALAPQLCRWLLQHLDRQVDDDMRVTHERIAGMLGVRREGVTEAALQLQREGLIRYSRGHIRVIDRRGLEQHSCECYRVVERAYEQLRSGSSARPRPAGSMERVSSIEGGRTARLISSTASPPELSAAQ
jgi:CRP-like cAMP-binding protein